MASFLSRIIPLVVVTFAVVAASIWADVGTHAWLWFQRSGSVITLVGAILGYRSIVRLGRDGVGGVNMTTALVKTTGSYIKDGRTMVNVVFDEATSRAMREAENDKRAGYVGAFMAVIGTAIWGYGDLIGRLFS